MKEISLYEVAIMFGKKVFDKVLGLEIGKYFEFDNGDADSMTRITRISQSHYTAELMQVIKLRNEDYNEPECQPECECECELLCN